MGVVGVGREKIVTAILASLLLFVFFTNLQRAICCFGRQKYDQLCCGFPFFLLKRTLVISKFNSRAIIYQINNIQRTLTCS